MTLYGKTDAGCAAGRPVELEDPTPERRGDSPDCFMPLGIIVQIERLGTRNALSPSPTLSPCPPPRATIVPRRPKSSASGRASEGR